MRRIIVGNVARMCFELDSVPGIPVLQARPSPHRDLELEATDGNRFAAFFAEPALSERGLTAAST